MTDKENRFNIYSTNNNSDQSAKTAAVSQKQKPDKTLCENAQENLHIHDTLSAKAAHDDFHNSVASDKTIVVDTSGAYNIDSPDFDIEAFLQLTGCDTIGEFMEKMLLKSSETAEKTIHEAWARIAEMIKTGLADTGGDLPKVAAALLEDAAAATDAENIPKKITIKRAETIEFPLDKINSNVWNLLETDTDGQLTFKMEKNGSRKEVNVIYSINFEEIEKGITITKRLLPFDKRVYIAVSALYNAGNDIITLTQIYHAMGYTTDPCKTDLNKINDSISKMMIAKIYVDNRQEADTYKYPSFIYDGLLLPLERVSSIVNGKLTNAALHIFREPPLIEFAKIRNQITTLDVKLLQSPISKTNPNLLIDDYLIERIARAKNGNGQKRILYKTLYEKAGITTTKQKQRTPAKVERYLKYYKECGMIGHYTMDKDGVAFYF